MTNRATGEALGRFVLCALLSAFIAQACSGDASSKFRGPTLPDAGVSADAAAAGGSGNVTNPDAARSCKAGAVECLGDHATQVCTEGGDWVAVPCGTGEHCAANRCETVDPCTPGDKVCATSSALKECDVDGSGWVVSLCGDQKICDTGACVVDVKGATCEPGQTQCADISTLLRCLPEGKGFESTDCAKDTPCTDGACRGPVCAVGETSCATNGFGSPSNAVRTCSDGKGFTEKPCASGTSCQVVTDTGVQTAKCLAEAACNNQGLRVCGNPSDPSADQQSSYAECQFGASGSLAWVHFDCVAPSSCDSANPGCTSGCEPGEKRCAGPAAYQECAAGGTWAAPKDCNASASAALGCRQKLGGPLPDAECVDSVCAALSRAASAGGTSQVGSGEGGVVTTIPAGAQGVCDGAQIRACTADGTLLPAKDCDSGACRAVGTGRVGGYLPAACTKECAPGERRCVSDGQPLYVECADDGTWSTAAQSCGSACTTATDDEGHRTVLCGDECLPGSSRCDGQRLQKCGDAFKWLASAACSLGRCAQTDGNAFCQVDCVPGEMECVGAQKGASDGSDTGTDHFAVCTAKGILPTDATACTGTETCRTSRTGTSLGCVECIGPKVPGGNDSDLADSRCTPTGGVQSCGDDNTWATATSCVSGSSCVVGRARTCGACPAAFVSGTCTAGNLSSTFNTTCENFGFGSSTRCGSTPDCCSAACTVSPGAFAFCAPDGFSPCLASADILDLGKSAPRTVTGSLLFGDDKLTPSCSSRANTPDAAYRFTAPRASTYSFDTFGSSTDTVVSVLDSLSCNEVACNDDAQGASSRAFANLVGGQQVLVVVEGTGDYSLHVVDTSVAGCGNGFVDSNEMCDGPDLGGHTCASATLGARPGGTLACTPQCAFDVTGCGTFGENDAGGTGGFPGTGGAKNLGD